MLTRSGEGPVEAAGPVKIRKTAKDKGGFPDFHRALENFCRKNQNAAASFPQLPPGPTGRSIFRRKSKLSTHMTGEYPIDAWHGDNQCPSFPDEFEPDCF